MKFNRKGFTLIELIIVVIIIGILAAIAAPMMMGNVLKAKKSEAVAALGAIRTAERLYYATYSSWPAAGTSSIGTSQATLNEFINSADLNGRFFNNGAYSLDGTGGCNANTKNSTDTTCSSQTADYLVTMDNTGLLANN